MPSLKLEQLKTQTDPNDAPVIAPVASNRLVSLDAYRGFVMLLMMGEVLSFQHVSESLPGNGFWRFLYFNQDHVQWAGCSLHDLIQPSFSFMVGVALPFSIAGRIAKGGKFLELLKHALIRSVILILLGIFLRSLWSNQTYFTFEDTLSQIGLGYTFLFLLGFCKPRVQLIALVVILAGYWAAFALYPLPGAGFDYVAAGVTPNWAGNFKGFAAHWNKNTNLAWAVDKWFLNLFPREHSFNFNAGGYSTLSFIPTLGTMIIGLLAGNMLRSGKAPFVLIRRFVVIGIALLAFAALLHFTGLAPVVKRIWTPGWVIFSGGCCFLLLALFYGLIDAPKHKRRALFLVVIGTNSIVAYVLADGFGSFVTKTLYTHLGQHYDQLFGDAYSTLVKGALVLLIDWLILYWLYRKKIFIKV
jgi:predicted acyltransferase